MKRDGVWLKVFLGVGAVAFLVWSSGRPPVLADVLGVVPRPVRWVLAVALPAALLYRALQADQAATPSPQSRQADQERGRQ